MKEIFFGVTKVSWVSGIWKINSFYVKPDSSWVLWTRAKRSLFWRRSRGARSCCASVKVSSEESPSPGWKSALLVKCPFVMTWSDWFLLEPVLLMHITFFILGNPEIKTVQPFTKVDLSQIPFHEIIRNFQILEAENVPENPLLYLYPNIPKDDAFGKFYTEKTGGD